MLTILDIDFIVNPQYKGYKGSSLNSMSINRAKHLTEFLCGGSNPKSFLAPVLPFIILLPFIIRLIEIGSFYFVKNAC